MDYRLVDSGEGAKLEKFGAFLLARPDPQAVWKKRLPPAEWAQADAVFETGKGWKVKKNTLSSWNVELDDLVFSINLKSFKHTGVFPEHVSNWKWISERLIANSYKLKANSKPKVLNLFGYTGGATLAAAKAGAEVVHVDSSKPSVTAAKENAQINNLASAPIRFIVDDALSFVKREVRRGNVYDGIILDPPSFGRGSKREVWKIEDDILPLLENCRRILPEPTFILLNGYAAGYSHTAYAQLLQTAFGLKLDEIESGELGIVEDGDRAFILPAGIFARWSTK